MRCVRGKNTKTIKNWITTMAAPSDVDVDRPVEPPVNTDALRRSGKISLWPYIMRELPSSPVEVLRLELLRQKMLRHPSALSTAEEPCMGRCRIGCGASPPKSVEFFPACLVQQVALGKPSIDGPKKKELEPQGGSGTHSPGPDSLRANPVNALHRDRWNPVGGHPAGASLREMVPSQQPATNTRTPPPSYRLTDGRRSTCINGKLQERRRPASSEARVIIRSQSVKSPLSQALSSLSSLLHNTDVDYTNCPSGCGEEVRVKDLKAHQTYLCSARYVDCLMPGCSTLVQARFLGVHMRQECAERRKQRLLADRGKILDMSVSCAECGKMLPKRQMRAHLKNDCSTRMVQCSNPGCTLMVRAGVLQTHKRIYCKTAVRNAKLYDRQTTRKPTEKCPACHENVAARDFRSHVAEGCPMRVVDCPNKKLGCGERIKAAEIGLHLRNACGVQIDRSERASRHESRQRLVQCSACGYMVVLQHLLHHQRTKCPDRRVPCKHWEVGCPAVLRLSKMENHLKVDRLLDPRSCLVFDGGRAYIVLEEEDRKPPWTVEMWIWRPPLIESTREKARTALKAYWELKRAREKLEATERSLRALEHVLIDAAAQASTERSTEAGDSRERLTDEMIYVATQRDNAKVDFAISAVLLSNTLTSATRGVEKITEENRSHTFERLALESTPWYHAVGSSSPACNTWEQRDGDQARAQNDEQAADLNSFSYFPTVLAGSKTDAKLPFPLLATAASEGALPPDACGGGSIELQREIVPEEIENGEAKTFVGIEDRATSILKEREMLEKIEEEESQRRETAFWTEWFGLSGQLLAQRLLTLAEETMPILREEAAVITGLTTEALFRVPVEEKEAPPRTTGGEDGDDDASASYGKDGRKKRKAENKAKRKQRHEEQSGKNLERRIADELRSRVGVETLFGSDKAVFHLEMGPSDRVGINMVGKNKCIFNYQCPRERWVHLSFVADSGGIFLLENGNTASRLHDVNVHLPMREIGGRKTACQVLVQEVRYWKVTRSKDELVRWMHQVLPSNAVQDGLLGYWTLEEGAGEYVHDATEQRFRARKVGEGLKWCTPENMCIVEVELRRGRLAQRGRRHPLLTAFISCSAGCGENFLRKDAGAHKAYRCPMRIVTCSVAGCGTRLPQKGLDSHLKRDCRPYAAWLRMAKAGEGKQEPCSCPHCAEIVKRCNLKLHEKCICRWVKEPCRNLGCGASIPRIRQREHEQRFCEAPCAVRHRRVLARARARLTYRRHWAEDHD